MVVNGTLNMAGWSTDVNGLSGSGTITGSGYLGVGDDGSSSNFGGSIQDGTGLNKNGGGNLTLSGSNTFSGNTTIYAGTLTAGATNTLSANSWTWINGGTLDVSSYANTVGSL